MIDLTECNILHETLENGIANSSKLLNSNNRYIMYTGFGYSNQYSIYVNDGTRKIPISPSDKSLLRKESTPVVEKINRYLPTTLYMI